MTADAPEEVVRETEEENSTLNVEVLETEVEEIGPETQRLLNIMTGEPHTQAIGVVKQDSDTSVIEESESESEPEIRKPPDIVESTSKVSKRCIQR